MLTFHLSFFIEEWNVNGKIQHLLFCHDYPHKILVLSWTEVEWTWHLNNQPEQPSISLTNDKFQFLVNFICLKISLSLSFNTSYHFNPIYVNFLPQNWKQITVSDESLRMKQYCNTVISLWSFSFDLINKVN